MRHSNEVFAAFKVTSMSQRLSAQLHRPDGSLKSFDEWRQGVQGITSHYCRAWLQTEYDTAIVRAHQAADWQGFVANQDVMPNLRWMPTTSPTPESGHRAFWERKLTLPVDDPFWDRHRPGDRYNCKCSLEATDDPIVPHEDAPDLPRPQPPQKGLENNPGKDGRIFSDKHPYFPENCSVCPFYKDKPKATNWLARLFRNERKKDCHSCPILEEKLEQVREAGQKPVKQRAKELLSDGSIHLSSETEIFPNLQSSELLRDKKVLHRVLAHCFRHKQLDAILKMWEHPEILKFERISPLGEGKNLDNEKDRKNLQKKKRRGVLRYNEYSFEYNGSVWVAKVEVHRNGFEQPYAVFEKKEDKDSAK